MVRRTIVLLAALAVLVALPAGLASAGVTGPAFYVDGDLYRTVGTQTDFSGTGAPARSFDVIYDFGGLQPNVATAAPGDPGFNGGRWRVHALAFDDYAAAVTEVDTNGSGDIDSDEEVAAALAADLAEDLGVVRQFECPVIPVPRSS
ncbi:MAG TPA: hypothetical protein VFT80_07445 [Actinomycetota bacterium]|nr:hypothetical protein [Actinomycetota bacterium]